MQANGFSVIADKLNFYRFASYRTDAAVQICYIVTIIIRRYLSHFRCVHRGAFFAQMKTTSGRKLLPESWGLYVLISLEAKLTESSRIPMPRSHARWCSVWIAQSHEQNLSGTNIDYNSGAVF
jgi:hypothetical protein